VLKRKKPIAVDKAIENTPQNRILNDKLSKVDIDLNDRIAFVKHLLETITKTIIEY
jgi:hypothetical protein